MAQNVLSKNPAMEYEKIPIWMGSMVNSLRISTGDFNFDQLDNLNKGETLIWWVIWFLVFLMGCLIFLNFIIAEVSASYANVKDKLDSLIYKERASMVREVEDFYS